MKVAIYPGSFDPLTNGHIDIIKRGLKVFDKIIVLISINKDKKPRFSLLERLEMAKESLKDFPSVEVDINEGLTIDYARNHHVKFQIRGIRASLDYFYEYELASVNHFIDKDFETVFFIAHDKYTFISSSSIIAMASNGVDVSSLVPSFVNQKIKEFVNK